MTKVSHRGALDVDEFPRDGIKPDQATRRQATRHNWSTRGCPNRAIIMRAQAQLYMFLCDCARTRQHEHRLVHALGEVHADTFVKWFVQSAPRQNNLNLLLAFREHGNVLSLFLCFITDTTTHRQFVILFKPRNTIPLNQHSLPIAWMPITNVATISLNTAAPSADSKSPPPHSNFYIAAAYPSAMTKT